MPRKGHIPEIVTFPPRSGLCLCCNPVCPQLLCKAFRLGVKCLKVPPIQNGRLCFDDGAKGLCSGAWALWWFKLAYMWPRDKKSVVLGNVLNGRKTRRRNGESKHGMLFSLWGEGLAALEPEAFLCGRALICSDRCIFFSLWPGRCVVISPAWPVPSPRTHVALTVSC